MTFAESEWSANSPDQQCYSLCIKLINASMTSCDFKMTYYDGIGDPKPRVCKLEILEMHGIERLYFGSLKTIELLKTSNSCTNVFSAES